MVADVNLRMLVTGQALGLALSATLAWAAEMPDPTRPPLMPSVADPASLAATSGPVLESVLIPRQGRPLAVISGKTVRLGERFGEDKLIKVGAQEVVLRGKDGLTRLPLNPAVSITPARQAPPAAPAGGSQ